MQVEEVYERNVSRRPSADRSGSNHAFTIATMIPTAARSRERILSTPPRTLGAKASRKPITPNTMAAAASASPAPALTRGCQWLRAAMIDGMPKCGLFVLLLP